MSKKTMLQRRAAQAAKRGQVIAPSANNIDTSERRYFHEAQIESLRRLAHSHSEGRARGVYKGAINPCAAPSKRYELEAPGNHYYPNRGASVWRDTKRD